MVSEMIEIFFSQYLANIETSGCGGDFSPQKLPTTLRFRDICKKRLNSFAIRFFHTTALQIDIFEWSSSNHAMLKNRKLRLDFT